MADQVDLIFDEGEGLSTREQQYDHTAIINAVCQRVDQWRSPPNPNQWRVTPETARLLQHWRHHRFSDIRPFFCQVEAVETLIWLTEVAPNAGKAEKAFLEHLANANNDANPELARLALKLATGARALWEIDEVRVVMWLHDDQITGNVLAEVLLVAIGLFLIARKTD